MGQLIQGANDLQTKYPNLAKEWDFAKNAPLSPDRVICGSNRAVWWICEKGHEWQDSINHRTSGRGCPYCSHRRLDIHNSIEERFPEISREWDYERNKPKTPNQFSKGSHESVYWKCPKGHPSYRARIANRIYKGDGCPICGGRKLFAGFNDLGSKYPVLATQWDYEKNFPVTPQDVFPREDKRYWWICPICNESYLATLANRTAGKNHKKCSQKGTSFPEQALFFYVKQLFPDARNRDTTYGFEIDIYIPSQKVAIEFDGVRYHNTIEAQSKDNNKDKLCDMLGITLYRLRDPRLPNTNSAIRIDCADDGRKGKLDEPIKLLLCRLDPHNEISVDAIRDYYTILAASLITIEQKSIVVTNPEMVAEWHPTLNLPLTPNKVTSGMGIKVWWKCNKCGNDYQAYVYSRKEGNGCPKCAINTRSAAKTSAALKTNSLVEKYPELVEEISIADNPGIDVARLAAGSKKHIFWQCKKCGNKWSAAINHRANGVGCPRCARQNTTNAAKRAVINLDTGEEYESLKEAAMACGRDKRSIFNCCSGLSKTAYGFQWKYRDESHTRQRHTGMLIRNIETGEIFQTIKQAADKYGCDRSAISAALRGKTKLSQGCHWEFVSKNERQ